MICIKKKFGQVCLHDFDFTFQDYDYLLAQIAFTGYNLASIFDNFLVSVIPNFNHVLITPVVHVWYLPQKDDAVTLFLKHFFAEQLLVRVAPNDCKEATSLT